MKRSYPKCFCLFWELQFCTSEQFLSDTELEPMLVFASNKVLLNADLVKLSSASELQFLNLLSKSQLSLPCSLVIEGINTPQVVSALLL